MLSFRDCLDLAEVTESEIEAIVKHSHIPPIVALELGHQLLQTAEGQGKLRDIIADSVRGAQIRHRCAECEAFSRTLSRYLAAHPASEDDAAAATLDLAGLAAIGEAEDGEDRSEDADPTKRQARRELEDAKDRSDCCACAELSLALVRMVA
jgi:hypothetical protein